jgi:ankyrin repeat protein
MMKQILRTLLYLLVFMGSGLSQAGVPEEFFRAVNVDNALTVRQLLSAGFDPNTPSEKGQTPLCLALREGSIKVVDALLADKRTQIDLSNSDNETPLMMAALRGHLDSAKRLLDAGAQLSRPGWTPLHYAATGPESAPVTRFLLERDAAVDAPSPNGTTPLMMAARYGSEDSVNLLLARGARLDARNVQNLSAADFAKLGGRERLAARLMPTPTPTPKP